jgi:hypothetical protein
MPDFNQMDEQTRERFSSETVRALEDGNQQSNNNPDFYNGSILVFENLCKATSSATELKVLRGIDLSSTGRLPCCNGTQGSGKSTL